jgi:hypothetical protein
MEARTEATLANSIIRLLLPESSNEVSFFLIDLVLNDALLFTKLSIDPSGLMVSSMLFLP